jgi:hypothetical protein
MSILQVNLGNYANDGTGDDLRTAFEKVNANFNELDLTRIITAENLGSGAPIFYAKNGTLLSFRSIKGGTNVEVSYNNNELTVSTVNLLAFVGQDTSPFLGGDLDLSTFDIVGDGNITINGDIVAVNLTGDLTGNVTGQVSDISNHSIDDLSDVDSGAATSGQTLIWNGEKWVPGEVQSSVSSSFDFGQLGVSASDPLQLALQFTSIDFDTFRFSSPVTLDFGAIDLVTVSYTLSRSAPSIAEGSAITITLETTNVPNGTFVPYIITGITEDDLNGSGLTGSFVVQNNRSTVTIVTAANIETEGPETATLTLTSISPTVSVEFTILETATEVDGGSPTTTEFFEILDGGSPTTTSFIEVYDGGLADNREIADGGLPTSSDFTETADGGSSTTNAWDSEYDGGLLA